MPNKIYYAPETAITFGDSGQTVAIALINLAFGAGIVSALYDRGAGSKPLKHEWRATIQFETAPAIGEIVELYLITSDGTRHDGEVTASAALVSDKRRNLKRMGSVVVSTTSVATNITESGTCTIPSRYFLLGVWNASAGDNLENTANACKITFTPIPDEIQ